VSGYAGKIVEITERAASIAKEVGFPEVLAHGTVTNDWLMEQLLFAGARRERASQLLSDLRTLLVAPEEMVKAQALELRTKRDGVLMKHAGGSITQGHAWGEREAAANLSVIEDTMELRRAEQALARLRDIVRTADDAQRAWRDTEWAVDRLLRLQQLRTHLGEV
jgi:hypothetical protein